MLATAAALATTGLAAGCGGADYTDTSDYGHDRISTNFDRPEFADDYEEVLELEDGRKVSLTYQRRNGLFEQHYSPEEDSWSKEQLLYPTDADPCQGITIVENHGRVAAIADFGQYCYDGEPPMESLAATADGSFQEWETHMTPGIDGWTEVDIVDADAVEWDSSAYPGLTFTPTEGFSGGYGGDEE